MPKDRAVFQPWTYTPTIKINDLDELKAFDMEFPEDKCEHGFIVSYKGQTLFWNRTKKDFHIKIQI